MFDMLLYLRIVYAALMLVRYRDWIAT